jgi:hypothetical protein
LRPFSSASTRSSAVRATVRAVGLAGILLAAAPEPARADWQLSPFIGLTFGGETTLLDQEKAVGNAHWHFGGAVRIIGAGPIGVEGLVVYTPGFFEQDNPPSVGGVLPPDVVDSRTLAVMGNVVLATPRHWTEYGWRPFVSGGIGLLSATANDALDLLPVHARLLGYNVGGGAVGFLNERTGFRFDFRYFGSLNPSDDPEIAIGRVDLSYWTGSVGVVFRY